MEYEFKSLKELYDRIKPALISKCSEFKKVGYKNIKESDIWNYLADKKWTKSKELTLSEMVEDIFSTNIDEINNYLIKKISDEVRKPNLEDIEVVDI